MQMSKSPRVAKAAPARTSAALAEELAALDHDIANNAMSLEALRPQRDLLVQEGDVDAIEAHDTRLHRLSIQADVLAAKRVKLAERHAEALADEEQVERRRIYKAGEKAAAGYRSLVDRYDELANGIAQVLGEMAQARMAIEAANRARPEGQDLIGDPEAFRGKPGEPARTEYVERPYVVDTRTGQEPISWTRGAPFIEERVRQVPVHVPAVPAEPAIPLAHLVVLPSVFEPHRNIWGHAGHAAQLLAPKAGWQTFVQRLPGQAA